MKLSVCYVLVQLLAVTVAQRTFLDAAVNIRLLRGIRDLLYGSISTIGRDGGRYLDAARDYNKLQPRVPDDVPFPCSTADGRSKSVPTSVHQLRPGDIDVIGAMGDSLSAGAGIFATSILQVAIENRGVAATGGGQSTWRDFLTLPNIIKVFNPKLIGYALGDSPTYRKESQFNVAETGAMSRDMPFMAKELVRRMRNDPRVDIKNHWKLISLMIGPNDFCTDMCWIQSPWSIIEAHKNDMIEVLRTLRDGLPRTFVLIVVTPSMKTLVEITGVPSFKCDITTNFECSCMFGLRYRSNREEYYEIMKKWQELEEEIATYSEFQTKDFTVVTMPLLTNLTWPIGQDGQSDKSYLSSDCFHLSQKTNARFANALWNNLLEPVGNKSRDWTPTFERFLCPSKDKPYLSTWGNSRSQPTKT